MRLLLLSILILTISINLSAQRNKNIKEIGFKNDEDFNVSTFPDKWKTESAIILCQKYDFSYVKFGLNSINFREIFRRRVFINDKKAKDKFSIYYFIERDDTKDNIGFIVEKPDGRKINVDLNEAVEVRANEVSSEYKSYYLYSDNYKKIAIPNLEVGDIIDYYIYGTTSKDGSREIAFSKFSFSLAKEYPILKQKFYFNVDKGFKVNFRAYNGAPEIVKGTAGVNKYGRSRNSISTYIIEDDNRDKLKDEIWKFNSLSEPWIKFQVHYSIGAWADKSTALIFRDKDLVNTPISKEVIIGKVLLNKSSMPDLASSTVSYISNYGEKGVGDEQTAELAYYYLRYYYFNKIRRYKDFDYKGGQYASINYILFSNTFSNILKELEVPFKYVISADRGVGEFNNVVFSSDVTTGIKVGDKCFYFFSNVSTPDMKPSYVEGAVAIEFSPNNSGKKPILLETKLPITSYDKNALFSSLTVNFDESMDTCFITNVDSIIGPMKESYNKFILYKTDYLNNDKMLYNPDYPEHIRRKEVRKAKAIIRAKNVPLSEKALLKQAERKREFKQKKDEFDKWRADFIIDYYDDDYKITTVDSVRIISSGRFSSNTSCVIKQVFKVDELVNKAGRNYIFKIGSLIGEQLVIDQEDMQRISDINITRQSSYNYNIRINIPEGYYVESVDALNYNEVNEMGEFTVKASIDGNTIKLITSKKYKTTYSTKDNWNDYIAFLEAAYEFSQKKIIIKKKK